jgi:hypothetical protein
MSEPEEIMKLHKLLISSKQFTFPVKGKVNVSENHGVYIIYSPTEIVLHVGNTPSGKKGLNQRLYNHVTRTSSFSRKYLKPNGISLRNGYKFRILEVSVPRTRALLEALTAGLLCPLHLGTGEKKKDT